MKDSEVLYMLITGILLSAVLRQIKMKQAHRLSNVYK